MVLPSPMSSARHAPEAELGHLHEPAEAALLVRAQRAVEVARDRRPACTGARTGPPRNRATTPARRPSATTSIGIPVSGRCRSAERRGQRLVGGERAAAARDQAAHLLELRRVDRHPLAAERAPAAP